MSESQQPSGGHSTADRDYIAEAKRALEHHLLAARWLFEMERFSAKEIAIANAKNRLRALIDLIDEWDAEVQDEQVVATTNQAEGVTVYANIGVRGYASPSRADYYTLIQGWDLEVTIDRVPANDDLEATIDVATEAAIENQHIIREERRHLQRNSLPSEF